MTGPGTNQGESGDGRKRKTIGSSAIFLLGIFSTCAPNRKSKQLFSKCLRIKCMDGELGPVMERAQRQVEIQPNLSTKGIDHG